MNTMSREEVKLLLAYYQFRTLRAGVVYWLIMLVAGVAGAVLWSWLAFPIALAAGWVCGAVTSYRVARLIEKRTGMNIDEQQEAWDEARAAWRKSKKEGR